MPSYNKVILMGNLTRDPELKYLPNQTAVCDVGLAVNERYKPKGAVEYREQVHYIDCVMFGAGAEKLAEFFRKGRPIFIEGKLRFEQWEDKQSGQKRSKLTVLIDEWKFVDSRQGGPQTGPARETTTRQIPGGSGVEEDEIPF